MHGVINWWLGIVAFLNCGFNAFLEVKCHVWEQDYGFKSTFFQTHFSVQSLKKYLVLNRKKCHLWGGDSENMAFMTGFDLISRFLNLMMLNPLSKRWNTASSVFVMFTTSPEPDIHCSALITFCCSRLNAAVLFSALATQYPSSA